jgi:hypothetical protein
MTSGEYDSRDDDEKAEAYMEEEMEKQEEMQEEMERLIDEMQDGEAPQLSESDSMRIVPAENGRFTIHKISVNQKSERGDPTLIQKVITIKNGKGKYDYFVAISGTYKKEIVTIGAKDFKQSESVTFKRVFPTYKGISPKGESGYSEFKTLNVNDYLRDNGRVTFKFGSETNAVKFGDNNKWIIGDKLYSGKAIKAGLIKDTNRYSILATEGEPIPEDTNIVLEKTAYKRNNDLKTKNEANPNDSEAIKNINKLITNLQAISSNNTSNNLTNC